MILIPENRKKHVFAVAELMYKLAPHEKKEQMYLLGLLHDIGYIYGPKDHNKTGGNLLKQSGYQYWQEVYYHGNYAPLYSSYELTLLNYADMHISPDGKYVSLEERLEDIKSRYGDTSEEYQNSLNLIKDFKQFFDDV